VVANKSVIRDIIAVFNTKVVVLALTLISSVIIARVLGADGRGLIALALIYPQLMLAIMEGGMRQSATYFLGKKLSADNIILGVLFVYIFIAGIAGAILVFLLMKYSAGVAFEMSILLVSATILPASLAVSTLRGYFLGKQQIKQFNSLVWLQKLVYVVVVIILALTDQLSVFSLILTNAVIALFNALQAFYFIGRKLPARPKYDHQTFKKMFKLGVVYAAGFFLIKANYQLDVMLLGWLSTTAELGVYALSVQLGELLWQLPAAVMVILMSKSANSQADGKSIIGSVCKSVRLTLLITFICCFGLLIASYILIGPVYGKEFSGAFLMIAYLAPGLVLAPIFKTINAYYAGNGRPHISILIMGTAVVVNVALNIIFIPSYGGGGAAVSSSVSYALAALLFTLHFANQQQVKFHEILVVKKSDFEPLMKKLRKQ
jgi:O-antigen/teichoic acid export membrane protein